MSLLCDSLATAICGPSYLSCRGRIPSGHGARRSYEQPPLPERPTPLLSGVVGVHRLERLHGDHMSRDRRMAPAASDSRLTRYQDKSGSCATHARHWRRQSSRQSRTMSRWRSTPRRTLRVAPHALDQLRMSVPASEINQEPIGPWQILVLGWQRSFELYGDSPDNPGSGAKRPRTEPSAVTRYRDGADPSALEQSRCCLTPQFVPP